MDILVVDGYNIIGDWDELNRLKRIVISQARNRLIELLVEYKAFTGFRIIVVFDALYVKGTESRKLINNVERSEEHTSELQSRGHLVCRLLLEKKNDKVDE